DTIPPSIFLILLAIGPSTTYTTRPGDTVIVLGLSKLAVATGPFSPPGMPVPAKSETVKNIWLSSLIYDNACSPYVRARVVDADASSPVCWVNVSPAADLGPAGSTRSTARLPP